LSDFVDWTINGSEDVVGCWQGRTEVAVVEILARWRANVSLMAKAD
jgi:hypothetical protein